MGSTERSQFGAVGGTPRFVASAGGARLVDVDGNEYVDLVCSRGAALLGHAHPAVVAAIRAAASDGASYGAPTAAEVELAEEIACRVPVERVRLVGSGTEATVAAVRLARGFTGRAELVRFAGCYHGHWDGLPAAGTIALPYNDAEAVRRLFAERGGRIACVITEGCPANMGVVPPWPEFNALLADLCRRHGALLILDEVLTGFRVSASGWYGIEGVLGDLMTFGRVMGGGLPAAALAGRAEIMDLLAPTGSADAAATAAGLATLRHATAEVYTRLDRASAALAEMVTAALDKEGVPHRIQRGGNLFSVFFSDTDVRDYDDARTQDTARYAAFFHAALDRGVYLPPSGFESWFVSAAHDDAVLDRVAEAMPHAARAAAKAGSA